MAYTIHKLRDAAAMHGVSLYAYMLHLAEEQNWHYHKLAASLGYTSTGFEGMLHANRILIPWPQSWLERRARNMQRDVVEWLIAEINKHGSARKAAAALGTYPMAVSNTLAKHGVRGNSCKYLRIEGQPQLLTLQEACTRFGINYNSAMLKAYDCKLDTREWIVALLKDKGVNAEVVSVLGMPLKEADALRPTCWQRKYMNG